MILKNVFEGSNLTKYIGIEKTLRTMGQDIKKYRNKDSDRLREESGKSKAIADSIIREGRPHDCMKDPKYVKARLRERAFAYLANHKDLLESSVDLVPGVTYYSNIRKSGDKVVGYRCTYLGKDRHDVLEWVPFTDSVRKMKIVEVLAHGSDTDFVILYADLADGKPASAAGSFVLEHLTESSQKAMDTMARYCDTRWEGNWPWELNAPKKFRDIIKENRKMRKDRLLEMRKQFSRLHTEIFEGEVEQSEVILKGREIAQDILDMIHRLGKISAEAMTSLKDQTRTAYGEDMARSLEQISNEHVGHAVDALSELKAAMEKKTVEMKDMLGQDPLGSDLDSIDNMYGGDGDEADLGDEDGLGDGDIDDLDVPDELDGGDEAGERDKK